MMSRLLLPSARWWWRRLLAVGALGTALAAHLPAADPRPAGEDQWLGINHGDLDQAALLGDLAATGLRVVRDGFNDPPDNAFAAKVAAYAAAKVDAHVVINVRGGGINVEDYAQWLRNYRQRCLDIMQAYKGRLRYYIVGNEPDMQDAFTGRLSPEQAVDFTRMAYEASREADPAGGILIESAPLSAPCPGDYLTRMLAAGLAGCCDVIGVHAYSNQVADHRLDAPWLAQQAAGGAQKPIAISELGITGDWAPKGFTPEQKLRWKADFLAQAYVQAKRYGIANVILFESSSAESWPATFALLRSGPPERALLSATWAELKDHLRPGALQDGGFEAANDFKHQWVVCHDPAEADWVATAYDFQARGGHAGAAALQIDTGAAGARIVRQVAGGLTVGRPVTVSAWAFCSNAAGATLKAEGWNATAGNAEVAATTKGKGRWEQLSVSVTPTNPWVVVELSTDGGAGVAGSFVRFDDVAVRR